MTAYLKWIALIVPCLLSAVIGRILAPVLPFFVQKDGYLPRWLWWFQTPDNPCDGDAGHWERWPDRSRLGTYARRVAWFLRNVMYGFNIDVLGVAVRDGDSLEVFGNTDASDTNGVSGMCKRYMYRDGKLVAFQIYYVKHYRAAAFTGCVRIGLGWKLWGSFEAGKVCQFMMYFNPLKKLAKTSK